MDFIPYTFAVTIEDYKKKAAEDEQCFKDMEVNFAAIASKFLGLILNIALCNFIYSKVLKRYSVPRILLEILLGIIFGIMNLDETTKYKPPDFKEVFTYTNTLPKTLENLSELIMIFYMFVLGLEMEPAKIFRKPTREHIVSFVGMLTASLLGAIFIFCTHLFTKDIRKPKDPKQKHSIIEFGLAMSITLSGTASPVLTRLITDMKIGKSDIGKFAVNTAMHTDIVSSLIICFGYFIHLYETGTHGWRMVRVVFMLAIQIVFAAIVGPIFLNWVNNENPEGKPIHGTHLVLSIAFMVLVCCFSASQDYSSILSAFILGLCLPREGRVSRMMISKLNYVLSNICYPAYFFWIGMVTKSRLFEKGRGFFAFKQLVVLFLITVIGKVSGTVLSGMLLGFHWPESLALGFLLSMKGHFHAYIAVIAMRKGYLYVSSCLMVIFVIFLTVVYTPAVVNFIIRRARKRSPNQKMAVQWLDPSSELRVLLCIQNPRNIPSTINFMEISRGTAEPGITVYATDTIELTEQVAATLVNREGMEAMTVSDRAVNEMRQQITESLQAYLVENDDGITLRRMLALSAINNMHQEICVLAEDLMVSLIVLPFHKLQHPSANLDDGNPGFRFVNRKVLRQAPCSVGILVDRGLGVINRISRAYPSLNLAVIFIGGNDDREALAYADRVARHPGIKMTVIRFLSDTCGLDTTSNRGGKRINIAKQEEEMKLDDECFAEFYDRQVAGGHVAYMEKYLANSSETLSTLQSFEGQYELIIVGQGRRVNSTLTMEMNDGREQYPELGPIGDILSSTQFSSNASVLIVQQHSLKGELDGLNDEFSIM